jgi:cell division topological specificity factor
MSLLDYLRFTAKKNTASLAKERLQIIVSHERATRNGPDYLPMLQKEILDVIAKYVSIDKEQVKVELERSGNCSILELNVTLPDLRNMEQETEA